MSPSPRFSLSFLGLIQGFMELSDAIQDTIIQGPIHWDLLTGFIWFSIQCLPPKVHIPRSHPGSHGDVRSYYVRGLIQGPKKISQGPLSSFFYKFSLNPKAHLSPIRDPLFLSPHFTPWTLFCLLTSSSFHFLTFSFTLGERERERFLYSLFVF